MNFSAPEGGCCRCVVSVFGFNCHEEYGEAATNTRRGPKPTFCSRFAKLLVLLSKIVDPTAVCELKFFTCIIRFLIWLAVFLLIPMRRSILIIFTFFVDFFGFS